VHRHGYDPERDRLRHLPAFGVDAGRYRPLPECSSRHYGHEIVFVGGCNPRRQAVIAQLLDLPIELYGGWLQKRNRFNLALRRRVRGKGVWGPELVELYHSSKIVLNISAWDPEEFSGLNLRVFDVPATGAFLLTDYSPELEEYYAIGAEIVCFRGVAELREKLRYFLDHPAEREAIARRGFQKSLTLPTITDRVKSMVEMVLRDNRGRSGERADFADDASNHG
jgi:spore maturation protein CgeB